MLEGAPSPAELTRSGVNDGEEEALLIAEGIWIAGLATMQGQGGLNSKDEK